MPRISPLVLEPALIASADPLAADLLERLRGKCDEPTSKTTRPFPRAGALGVYRRKAAQGDRPRVRTEGYAELLTALSQAPEGEVVVHGLAFADAVYLVFTDPGRRHCIGMLRKVRLPAGP
ncbi:MAG TPA: hypothetical protein VFG66_08285 [Gemmatimonadales bacterium]|nr:hypothetical protein [Gemmatimonadales bacterium]